MNNKIESCELSECEIWFLSKDNKAPSKERRVAMFVADCVFNIIEQSIDLDDLSLFEVLSLKHKIATVIEDKCCI